MANMAAGLLEPLVAFWKYWGILVLVLLSFTLQVILLITAEIRRLKDSGVLQVVVWSAYLLADTTAMYALGHMSVISTEHQLMSFWAPFLLLHLGGKDNITAYSIEDNRLWLRHLQSFVVQVMLAGYVLYQSTIMARRTLLRLAAILMSAVGVVKYGERVCALKLGCSGSRLSGKNYQTFEKLNSKPIPGPYGRHSETYRAHLLLNTPKNLLKEPCPVAVDSGIKYRWEELYGVAQMQLSMMHDLFYTKAELIHTWHGYCIRALSLPATVTALLLFRQFSEKDGYRAADVAATYLLLTGAVVLEIISVLRAMFSTWTYGKLVMRRVVLACTYDLASTLHLVRSHVVAMYDKSRGRTSTRYWSGSMGQHNLIYMFSHCKDSRWSKIARRLGWEDWWSLLFYASSVPVSPELSELLKKRIEETDEGQDKRSREHIHAELSSGAGDDDEEFFWSVDTELDKTILVWHIATHVYLSWYEAKQASRPRLAQVTKKISNYMMFLLAARPYMLPDNVDRRRYVELCHMMIYHLKYSSEEDLLRLIRITGNNINGGCSTRSRVTNMTYTTASQLASKLISKHLETPDANLLELISQVWLELLCYAAHRCKPDSHARQLSNGGELTTVLALMFEYKENGILLVDTEGDV